MNFGSIKSDWDKLENSIYANGSIDTKPTEPEHKNWKLRPRLKSVEIGPEFRFGAHLQVERIMDNLK